MKRESMVSGSGVDPAESALARTAGMLSLSVSRVVKSVMEGGDGNADTLNGCDALCSVDIAQATALAAILEDIWKAAVGLDGPFRFCSCDENLELLIVAANASLRSPSEEELQKIMDKIREWTRVVTSSQKANVWRQDSVPLMRSYLHKNEAFSWLTTGVLPLVAERRDEVEASPLDCRWLR
ncbi:unnamed protein product, partial [Symbiodinium microadriaticum]